MSNKKNIFLLIGLAASVFLSCHKETSCEGCIDSNKPPVAKAGNDIIIDLPQDSVFVDGGASYDPDGAISNFRWSKISGSSSCIISNSQSVSTTIKNLTQGNYQFELKVTDSKGVSDTDTLMVTVNGPVITNHPPIANAGFDQTITLPTNTVTLNGFGSTDPDNNITTYQWSKISGSVSFSISSPNAVQTQITALVEGTYQFELKVTDAGGLDSKDTVVISVVSTGFTEVIFKDQRWINQCYDPNPGVCWINSDAPSYGFYINDTANLFPNSATAILGVWVKMDTSTVWESVPNNCWVFPDTYPQTNFTYCLTSDSMSIYSWFFSWQNLGGRKADVRIRF